MRYLLVAIAVHAIVLAWLHDPRRSAVVRGRVAAVAQVAEEQMIVDVIAEGGGGTPGAPPSSAKQRTTAAVPPRSVDAWENVSISVERPGSRNSDGNGNGDGDGDGDGDGNGNGNGNDGHGHGHGHGDGMSRVRVPDDVPAVPVPAPIERVSKARPAKLIFPSRDRDVEDEADLFVARVTVDAEGDVVGARMLKTRPGSRGEQAADAIWSFRYLPALNDDGLPIRSTFEQPFQIR